MRIGFIGAGTVATALAVTLARRGYQVSAVASRTRASADMLAKAVGEPARVSPTNQGVADACDFVFITTPDDAIRSTAEAIRWRPDHKVVHASGALSLECLASVVRIGSEAGGFHPLQTFAFPKHDPFAGCTIALEGTDALLLTLEKMATDLGCGFITLGPLDKARYHISGVLACNYVVTLVRQASALWEQMGFSKDVAKKALLPLVRGTLDNMERNGIAASLTGPIARGDSGTVKTHVEELARTTPGLLPAYRELGLLTVSVAEETGRIEEAAADQIRDMLGSHALTKREPRKTAEEVWI